MNNNIKMNKFFHSKILEPLPNLIKPHNLNQIQKDMKLKAVVFLLNKKIKKTIGKILNKNALIQLQILLF